MIGLRDIRVVESTKAYGGNAHPAMSAAKRRRQGSKTGMLALAVLLLLCVLVVGWNITVLQGKKSGKRTAGRGNAIKLEISEDSVEESSSSSSSSSGTDDGSIKQVKKHHHHHHHHHHHDKTDKSQQDHGGGGEWSQYGSLEERIRSTVHESCDFKKLPPDAPHACLGPPEVEEGWGDLFEKTGCDIFTVPFNPENDEGCLKMLTDTRQWAEVKPMKQQYDERTVKFKVKFKADPRLRAIVKVPQKLFPYEAMSEVGSFFADRVMQQNRVPPTAWIHCPVKVFEAAAKEFGGSIKLIPQFANESKVSNYYDWIMKDFINYNKHKGLTTDDDPDFPDETVVGVSIQLFVADVRPLLSSDLAIPWVPHNDSWQRHLNPEHPFQAKHAIGFVRQAELSMFDYVLGCVDRSPNKNNFVVGACRHHHTPSKCGTGPRHPGAPSFLSLDNGMMFMFEPSAARSADGPNALVKRSYCMFEKRLLARLKELNEIGFSTEMNRAMPQRLKRFITTKLLHKCDHRLAKILHQLEYCIEKYGEEKVVVA